MQVTGEEPIRGTKVSNDDGDTWTVGVDGDGHLVVECSRLFGRPCFRMKPLEIEFDADNGRVVVHHWPRDVYKWTEPDQKHE